LLEGVRQSAATGAAQFSISGNGELVYITSEQITRNRALAVVDRTTTRNSIQLPPGLYNHPRVAPDGKQLAVTVDGQSVPDIWIYDLTGAVSPRRFTSEATTSTRFGLPMANESFSSQTGEAIPVSSGSAPTATDRQKSWCKPNRARGLCYRTHGRLMERSSRTASIQGVE